MMMGAEWNGQNKKVYQNQDNCCCKFTTASVMSSWQFRRGPHGSAFNYDTPKPLISLARQRIPPTTLLRQGGYSYSKSQQVLLRSISRYRSRASATWFFESASHTPSEATTRQRCDAVILCSVISGRQVRQGPLNSPGPWKCCSFLRQQSPMVRVGCSLPFRQKTPPSSLTISSSLSSHSLFNLSLSLRLFTDSLSFPFTLLIPLPSLTKKTACESPALARQTKSLWTTAVRAQVPTLRMRLLPILSCCSQVSKKASSRRRQLALRDSLMASPTDAQEESRSRRQLSMKLWILLRQYSASSAPPCPSNTLIANASRCLSWSQASVSSQGLLASYCSDFTRLSMMFFCRLWSDCGKEQVDLQVSSSSAPFASPSSTGTLNTASPKGIIRAAEDGNRLRLISGRLGGRRGEGASRCGWMSLFLRVGMMIFSREKVFMHQLIKHIVEAQTPSYLCLRKKIRIIHKEEITPQMVPIQRGFRDQELLRFSRKMLLGMFDEVEQSVYCSNYFEAQNILSLISTFSNKSTLFQAKQCSALSHHSFPTQIQSKISIFPQLNITSNSIQNSIAKKSSQSTAKHKKLLWSHTLFQVEHPLRSSPPCYSVSNSTECIKKEGFL